MEFLGLGSGVFHLISLAIRNQRSEQGKEMMKVTHLRKVSLAGYP